MDKIINKKVLIVEDDLFLSDIYNQIFTKRGYSVINSYDGEDALKRAKEEEFGIIMLDIMLPKKTGIDVLREVRSTDNKSKEVPIFMLTNLGYDDIIKTAFELGANGYLVKSTLLPVQIVDEVEAFFDSDKIVGS
jgi:two-component system response regulator VicR